MITRSFAQENLPWISQFGFTFLCAFHVWTQAKAKAGPQREVLGSHPTTSSQPKREAFRGHPCPVTACVCLVGQLLWMRLIRDQIRRTVLFPPFFIFGPPGCLRGCAQRSKLKKQVAASPDFVFQQQNNSQLILFTIETKLGKQPGGRN